MWASALFMELRVRLSYAIGLRHLGWAPVESGDNSCPQHRSRHDDVSDPFIKNYFLFNISYLYYSSFGKRKKKSSDMIKSNGADVALYKSHAFLYKP